MLVKCKICGEKIERDLVFKIVVNGKNNYYCNENEYINWKNKKDIKENIYICIYEMFGRKITNTVLFKEINELAKIYTNEKLLSYLKSNEKYLSNVISKDFTSEYAQIRYFTAILKNSLSDYIEDKTEVNTKVFYDIPKDNYKSKPRRRSLIEYEKEVGDEL